MILDRRTLLVVAPGLIALSALGQAAPPALEAYERETGGRIGLYAENLATGAKIAWRADERFVMCSTFKASLAAFVLARADRGEDNLERMIPYGPNDLLDYAPTAKQNLAKGAMSVADMCEAAVELSDNTCANLLLERRRSGRPDRLLALDRRCSHAPYPHDTTTPAAMAGNLRRFVLGEVLSPESRERLTGWMLNCKTGDHRLRAGLPNGWRIGDKTGNNGKDASGDIAVAWPKPGAPVLICAYTQGGSPTAAQLEAAFAEIGRMAGQRLG